MPSPQRVREISAAGALDPRTVRKAYRSPEKTKPTAWERVSRAAVAIGEPPPPKPVAFAKP